MVSANILLGLVAVIASGVSANADINKGNVYWYPCGNCKCNAQSSLTGFTGTTGCQALDSSNRALGLTGNGKLGLVNQRYTECKLYIDDQCQHEAQRVGVYRGQKWGCTAFNQDTKAIKCTF
ncbi:hypothetical protein NQ176_g5691 [Zarea fungicola]|uniref:Uncharacterized protein n=1 Tax=Zarea fungicola TaxID=93591 RepID=A0ACC1N9L1_9HYPO|nr:hypothetical protein NQ176_g5691 [Lecanicillium fungicola]